jgi:hypothetical protein
LTRFVVDTSAVLHLAAEKFGVAEEHELFAPTLLRSQTLSALHEAVHRGELSEEVARSARVHRTDEDEAPGRRRVRKVA